MQVRGIAIDQLVPGERIGGEERQAVPLLKLKPGLARGGDDAGDASGRIVIYGGAGLPLRADVAIPKAAFG